MVTCAKWIPRLINWAIAGWRENFSYGNQGQRNQGQSGKGTEAQSSADSPGRFFRNGIVNAFQHPLFGIYPSRFAVFGRHALCLCPLCSFTPTEFSRYHFIFTPLCQRIAPLFRISVFPAVRIPLLIKLLPAHFTFSFRLPKENVTLF